MSYLDEYITSAQLVDFQSLDAVFVDLDDTIVDYRNCSIYGLGNVKYYHLIYSVRNFNRTERPTRNGLICTVFNLSGQHQLCDK